MPDAVETDGGASFGRSGAGAFFALRRLAASCRLDAKMAVGILVPILWYSVHGENNGDFGWGRAQAAEFGPRDISWGGMTGRAGPQDGRRIRDDRYFQLLGSRLSGCNSSTLGDYS